MGGREGDTGLGVEKHEIKPSQWLKQARARLTNYKHLQGLQGEKKVGCKMRDFSLNKIKTLAWTKNRGGSDRDTGFVLKVSAAAVAASLPPESLPSGSSSSSFKLPVTSSSSLTETLLAWKHQ